MIINNLLFLFFAIKNTLLEKKVCPKHTWTIYVYSYSLCFQGVNVFAIECMYTSLSSCHKECPTTNNFETKYSSADCSKLLVDATLAQEQSFNY